MFDIGWTEITFILIFTIIVIGPKELPKVLRTVGQWIGKAKSITSEFRGHVDEMIRDTELDEVKKKIDTAGQQKIKSSGSETEPGNDLFRLLIETSNQGILVHSDHKALFTNQPLYQLR